MRLFEVSNLFRLRTVAIVAPLAFAVSLGVFTDQVLERWFSLRMAQVMATTFLTLAVISFAFWIFGVLGLMQSVIEKQRERERDQAAEVARAMERERIGIELHDGVIQAVYGVQLKLEGCLAYIEAQPQAAACINGSIDELTTVVGKMREYIFGLRPYLDGQGDLPRALADLIRETQANASIQAVLELDDLAATKLDDAEASTLLEFARNALASAARRGATQLVASLKADGSTVHLQLADNGSKMQTGDPDRRSMEGIHAGAAAPNVVIQVTEQAGRNLVVASTLGRQAPAIP
jgi:signal transduction histidine kinase